MINKAERNREKIIDAAMQLFYEHGFNQTSFKDVSEATGIPKGNFYYYFKSKDDLLKAVIDERRQWLRLRLQEWHKQSDDPRERLKFIVSLMQDSAENASQHGCPIGSLNAELTKNNEAMLAIARGMFDLLLEWAEEQLRAMGKGDESRDLALHILAMSQGSILMGSVYHDRDLLLRESNRLRDYLDTL
ncbi:MAG: TetR/AcrR family transcriptional regulator [Gammaproteobacteria bacterium]|nr:TetR/AcrR family transcriptional regulator [Gammaproteobacteria bacterium]